MISNSQKNVSETDIRNLVGRISHTVRELEKSVRASQVLERKQFQNELQLHIDKHQLSLSLDQQKYHNKRLTKLAMSLSDSSSGGPKTGATKAEDVNGLRERCEELKVLLRKREMQLKKTRAALKQVTEDNIKLARAYELRSSECKELNEKNGSLKLELAQKLDSVNDLSSSGAGCSNVMKSGTCEHESALRDIQMFYETQIAELSAQLEEHSLYSTVLEEQELCLAQERSLAEFEESISQLQLNRDP